MLDHSNMVGSVAAHDGGKCFARVDNLLYHFSNVELQLRSSITEYMNNIVTIVQCYK